VPLDLVLHLKDPNKLPEQVAVRQQRVYIAHQQEFQDVQI